MTRRSFTDYEQRLFTRVVALAEKHGKPVNLLVVPANNIFDAVAQTAIAVGRGRDYRGAISQDDRGWSRRANLGRAWERLAGKAAASGAVQDSGTRPSRAGLQPWGARSAAERGGHQP